MLAHGAHFPARSDQSVAFARKGAQTGVVRLQQILVFENVQDGRRRTRQQHQQFQVVLIVHADRRMGLYYHDAQARVARKQRRGHGEQPLFAPFQFDHARPQDAGHVFQAFPGNGNYGLACRVGNRFTRAMEEKSSFAPGKRNVIPHGMKALPHPAFQGVKKGIT